MVQIPLISQPLMRKLQVRFPPFLPLGGDTERHLASGGVGWRQCSAVRQCVNICVNSSSETINGN